MLPKLENDGDWVEVFKYASEPRVPVGENVSDDSFYREDVKRIIHMYDGENDGESWHGAFELKDGRFAYLEAGCDYTGWG